jgi:hypothetical protein
MVTCIFVVAQGNELRLRSWQWANNFTFLPEEERQEERTLDNVKGNATYEVLCYCVKRQTQRKIGSVLSRTTNLRHSRTRVG